MSAASWSPAKASCQSPSSAFPNFFGSSSCSSAATALLIRESDRSGLAHSSSRRFVSVAEAEITARLCTAAQCRSGIVATRRLDATARKPAMQREVRLIVRDEAGAVASRYGEGGTSSGRHADVSAFGFPMAGRRPRMTRAVPG
jgi:hypothetical protein